MDFYFRKTKFVLHRVCKKQYSWMVFAEIKVNCVCITYCYVKAVGMEQGLETLQIQLGYRLQWLKIFNSSFNRMSSNFWKLYDKEICFFLASFSAVAYN